MANDVGLMTHLIDILRRSSDRKALGPMQYDIISGHAVPATPNGMFGAALTPAERRPTGGGARRDDRIAQALRDAGA